MSANRWSQSVEDAGVPVLLNQVSECLGYLKDYCDSEEMREWARLDSICRLCADRSAGRKAETIGPDSLARFRNAIQTMRDGLEALRPAAEQGGALDLRGVNDGPANNVLTALGEMPVTPTRPRQVEQAIADVDDRAHTIVDNLGTLVGEVESECESATEAHSEKLSELASEIAARTNELNTLAETIRRDFAAAVDTSRAAIAGDEEKMRGLLAQQETNFSQLLVDQRGALDASLVESRDAVGKWTAAMEQEENERAKDAAARAEETLAKLTSLDEEAMNLVGAIGMKGQAAGYGQNADEQKKSATRWRIMAMVCGGLAVAVLILAVVSAGKEDASWLSLAAKSGVSVGFGTMAAYAGRLASRHEKRAGRSRQMQLALASLNPYMEPLSEEKKEALRQELAGVFFTHLDDVGESDESPDWQSQATFLQSLVNQLLAQLSVKSN